ncbi:MULTISPECIES: hypothetical protein [unclassified Sulfitobacter]|uniref:hypothetical protein n=1 Tax=unclassified Sulfitobacter TaxID=196795 RepID=UPI0023E1E06A|nr:MULTISPECIES: hypothetical protein [unclassified Sulfitobacter]MDF3415786.1 hypothetical protein [Sulfitobacter sp. KE5]MDF3423266.1 hypothetical protein [Sulfitobacter sp. KE43]MDF3475414.1 hypothetical protein [Sulfitobacter sp. M48]MDF3491015.1 hypothetical protein [Sulfitobacter sp. M60]MDF3498822.1 hypothetical protein [Sulfitobacter sp. M56]MDF3502728.1 hypothetical protein [Sulfitobacter sp. Ks17]MDF3518327.1 hypothetical protein [Sulfitobacter sp. M63]MDF3537839.1 hypothetical pr
MSTVSLTPIVPINQNEICGGIMSGLADMEELLSLISNKDFVEYMREANSCYNVGAYRGCIVMSYITLFDDLRLKLDELAKVNSEAKKVALEVKKRANEQEVFETYMADQLKAKGLLEEKKYQRLSMIRDLRNKAAHPSGVLATAEEARFVYRTVISEFLSEALLKTTHAVDALIERVKKSNHFPSTNINEIIEIVDADCASIHDLAVPYLVTKLLQARDSAQKTASQNAERFLVGMSGMKSNEYRSVLRKKALEPNCTDSDAAPFIGRIIAADGQLLAGLSKTNKARVCKLLTDQTKTSKVGVTTKLSHPARQISELVSSLGETVVSDSYTAFFEAVLAKYPYSPVFYNGLQDAPKLKKTLISDWLEDAGSSTFDIANAFAKALPEVDEAAKTILTPKDSFEIIVAVCRAADTGAWSAKSVQKSKFSDCPELVHSAREYAKKNKESAKKKVVSALLATNLKEFLAENLGT